MLQTRTQCAIRVMRCVSVVADTSSPVGPQKLNWLLDLFDLHARHFTLSQEPMEHTNVTTFTFVLPQLSPPCQVGLQAIITHYDDGACEDENDVSPVPPGR